MNIAIIGANGFIGSNLRRHLETIGHTVRKTSHQNITPQSLDKCDVIINLAGANINKRWTNRYKNQIIASRTETTKRVVEVINGLTPIPKLFINASAVGIYPSIGCHDESSISYSDDFLSKVSQSWEREAYKANDEIRTVVMRLGVVIAPDGGAMKQLVRPIKVGVAATIGSGKQAFSWIAMDDLLRAVEFIISNPNIRGVVNMVAPQSIANSAMTEILADKYKAKIRIHIPVWFITMIMGQRAQIIVSGQCVEPKVLINNNFLFNFKTFKSYINSL